MRSNKVKQSKIEIRKVQNRPWEAIDPKTTPTESETRFIPNHSKLFLVKYILIVTFPSPIRYSAVCSGGRGFLMSGRLGAEEELKWSISYRMVNLVCSIIGIFVIYFLPLARVKNL